MKLTYLFLNLSNFVTFLFLYFSGLCFIIQLAITGTNVCEAKKEAIIAEPTAIESGINMSLGIPTIIREGVNTARILSKISNFGTDISNNASIMALGLLLSFSKCW